MSRPNPLLEVQVPKWFSPSRFAAVEECRLRAVMESSESDVRRLPAGPWAPLGTVLHQLLEDAANGRIEGDGEPGELAESHFQRLLERQERKLSQDNERKHFVPLRDAFDKLKWLTKTKSVVRRATSILGSMEHTGTGSGEPVGDDFWKHGDGVGSEVPMQSEALRIRGIADWVRRQGDVITIRDFKTGTVLDEEYRVAEHIQTQLRLYGLIALEAVPSAKIELEVSKGREHGISFGPEEIASTRETVDELLGLLPAGKQFRAEELASPGEACRWCSVRHRCPAYREWAPKRWTDACEHPIPTDVWGEVVEVETRDDGLREVRLKDAAGRWVRVFGLDEHHPQMSPGDEAWFFGLGWVWTRTRSGESYRHPQNFHEVPSSPGQRRAWTLKVFVESGD